MEPNQILQTRLELVHLAITDFKSVVSTIPPPEDTLSLYHSLLSIQELFILLTKKIGMISIIPKRISQIFYLIHTSKVLPAPDDRPETDTLSIDEYNVPLPGSVTILE